MQTYTYYTAYTKYVPITITLSDSNTTSQCTVNPPLNEWGCVDKQNQEPVKETAMSIEQNQTDYLNCRARDTYNSLCRNLWDQFNIHVDNYPKTYKELIDAIKGGKFKLDEKRVKLIDAAFANDGEDDDFGFFNFGPFDGIIFDGPQPDPKGKALAEKELKKLYTKTKDAIAVYPAAEALKALQEFEAWVPSNLPKN